MGIWIKRNGAVKLDSSPRVKIDCTLDAADFIPGTDSIVTEMVEDGAITAGKIGTGAVTAAKIGTGAVTAIKIGAEAVETAAVKDLNITLGKLAASAVSTAKVAAGAITPPKLSTTGIKFLRFGGKNGAGAITLTGAAVGDRVVFILGSTLADSHTVVGTIPTQFEATISVVNQIQQADATDLTVNDYWVVLLPPTS